jgi:colicin import membrane protein
MESLPRDSLKTMVLWSAAGHLALAAALALRAYMAPSQPLQLENAIRVDLVGLPDKPKTPPPPVAPQPAPVQPTQPAPEPPPPVAQAQVQPTVAPPVPIAQPASPKPNTAAQSAAIRRLEALQRLRQQQADQRRQEIAGMIEQRPIRGNQVSRGSSASGLIKQEQAAYLDSLNASIRANWSLPRWLQNSTYRARIVIYIDSGGRLLKKEFRQRSGNATFDEQVEAAIQRSIPLPAPPSSIAGVLQTDGVELGFPD